CWKFWLGQSVPLNFLRCLRLCCIQQNSSRVHVQNVQVSYIGIHLPWWFAVPINQSSTLGKSFTSL
uniref:Uncharacterized protein n=1 Tax=Macaca fascicularis TaxID=9541 RepID=A0A7N9CKK4_MACFA